MNAKPKIIILLTIDCLRYDYLEHVLRTIPKGWGRIIFRKHYANAPYTWASFPSIFTSTPPFMMGSQGLKERISFTKVLSSRGYLTIGINGGNPWLSSKEYSKIFDKYVNLLGVEGSDHRNMRTSVTMKVSRALINGTRKISDKLNLVLDGFFEGIYFSAKNIIYKAKFPLFDAFLITSHIIRLLASIKNKYTKVFLWAHFMDLHFPYASYVRAKRGLLHASKVIWDYVRYEVLGFSSLDALNCKEMYELALNYLLSSLKVLFEYMDEAFSDYGVYVIITSDHGEEFGEHGALGHEGLRLSGLRIPHLYEENIRVPFIITSPSIDCNSEVKYLTSHLDVAPTIVAIDDENLSSRLRQRVFLGKNLLELISNNGYSDSFYITAESDALIAHGNIGYGKAFALIKCFDKYCFKYIWNPVLGEELYDLEKDPHERMNLMSSLPEIAKEFRGMLYQYLRLKKRFELKYKINLALLRRRILR